MMRKFGKGMGDKMGRALMKKGAAGRAMMGMKKGVKKMADGGMLPVDLPDDVRERQRISPALAPANFDRIDARQAAMQARAAARGGREPTIRPRMPSTNMRGIPTPVPVNRPIREEVMYKKGGKVKSGSSASKRADGIAHKGKTKGKMVKMAYGGKC